ncbi:uncharacterized protein LOC143590845 [Bidens hawaiensis]|uniref:uncharacterized protein LOC143590845 n=1 Tax=Bidens hawaiensis TaxID=980011 RepID=UPI00404B399E
MIGSVDCVHWKWANCPTACRGQYTRGDQKGPTVRLQSIASYDLWIWSAFFGIPISNNDITILEQSPMMESYISGTVALYWAYDNFYHHGYYLGDGIYPEYAIIVKTFRDPLDVKRQYFKKVQESARKDIERCFGVIQRCWNFVKIPCCLCSLERMKFPMHACIIMHNMIIEDE